jgi:hypothetical protein
MSDARDNSAAAGRPRRHREASKTSPADASTAVDALLDEALRASFPASDPISSMRFS